MAYINVKVLKGNNLELSEEVMDYLDLSEGDQVMLMCKDDELIITNPRKDVIAQIKEVEKIAHALGARFAEETAYKYSGFFEQPEIQEYIKGEEKE